jgi:1A family penicillin-binding protein
MKKINLKNLYNKLIKNNIPTRQETEDFFNWGGEKTNQMINTIVKKTRRAIRYITKMGWKKVLMACLLAGFVLAGAVLIWVATFEMPDLDNFAERKVVQSTKIFDRTGRVILFDVHGEVTRTVVTLDHINDYAEKASIAIEDSNFYNHNGVEIKAIFRAILTNLRDGNLLSGQGGSTITQQVIKNALLTSEKKVSRKLKEWVLAPRLEAQLTKDEILEIYLNEIPYGGTVYGIQEASRRFFSKDAADLSLAESAYLAALPQAPTYFSPYGNNLDKLESRKNKVLKEMLDNKFISKEEFDSAMATVVDFQKPENFGIKAPHFVFWIIQQLEEKYGVEAVEQGGLKVTTTLDWELQEEAEAIVKKHALENASKYNAENASVVATDPKTGEVLVMVGSRDYFDEEIDGNFNIATTERQPGSAFKPFVYAEAFNKGYRPETMIFDIPTEFSTTCASGGGCYNPQNYDNVFRGPMSLRDALAQSVNIPAVKVLYLAGIKDSLNLAKKMGIETLTNVNQYGLTLVLGGGEVRPLDMAAAYGVFANDGVKAKTQGILKVEDIKGKTLEEFKEEKERVMPEQTARLISDVLSDNIARTPAFGSSSYLNIPGVAVKTGTTNDYRDAWIVGYTPEISLAAWAGNNDNSSMEKKVAGFIVAPMWNEFMQFALTKKSPTSFSTPAGMDSGLKPIIAGNWNYTTDGVVHTILHWVDTSNPLGGDPRSPSSDSQYWLWENAVQAWQGNKTLEIVPEENTNEPQLQIINPSNGDVFSKKTEVYVAVQLNNTTSQIKEGTIKINGKKRGDLDASTRSFLFIPDEINNIKDSGNTLEVEITDTTGNKFTDKITFGIN